MPLQAMIVEQFRRPSGPLGSIAGWIMANRASNLERNRWTIALLGIETGDRVLELGFGPGVAIGLAAERVGPTGKVVGLDHSSRMLAQAARRNRRHIAEGRVELMQARLADLTPASAGFDKVFSCNVLQFEPDVGATLRALGALVRPGGRLATTFQPRARGATAEDSRAFARLLERALPDAGFADPVTHELPLSPAPAVCIIASAHGSGATAFA